MSSDHRVHLHLYGIKNCDSCRNAMKWLEAHRVPFTFHDFRVEELSEELVRGWLDTAHARNLLNKRSTSWRKLSDEDKQQAETGLLQLFLAHPTLIKRPVITDGETILDIGYSPDKLKDYV